MKAALLNAPRDIRVVDLTDPRPTASQVLVRMNAASICGSDLTGYRGENPRTRFPTVPGHEIAGTVVSAGHARFEGLVGQQVIIEPNVSCRACEWCRAGLPNVCVNYRVLGESLEVGGGLAELVAVAADQVYTIPAGVTAIEAAIIQPLSVAYHAVVNRGAVRADETVLILGAGPIGLASLLIARHIGARSIVVDVVKSRVEKAERLGATLGVLSTELDLVAAVREATNGRGADVTIEAVGGAQGKTIQSAVNATAIRGRIVVVGTFEKRPQALPGYLFKNREQTIIGSHGHPGTFPPTIDLVAQGKIRVGELVSQRMPLAEAAAAFELLDSRADGVVKVVLTP